MYSSTYAHNLERKVHIKASYTLCTGFDSAYPRCDAEMLRGAAKAGAPPLAARSLLTSRETQGEAPTEMIKEAKPTRRVAGERKRLGSRSWSNVIVSFVASSFDIGVSVVAVSA